MTPSNHVALLKALASRATRSARLIGEFMSAGRPIDVRVGLRRDAAAGGLARRRVGAHTRSAGHGEQASSPGGPIGA